MVRARLKPGTWRGIHWLAYASWPIALAHTFGLGTDSRERWVVVLGVVCALSVGLAVAWRVRATARQRAVRSMPNPRLAPLTRRLTTASTSAGRSRHDA